MVKRMLIDATHAEETRVVVMDGNRLEDYDVEAANRRQLKGNIYLAKVIRVEPSLQAAFVEYGGNRHGFLAFSEIHPDYYQIPVADREKLLALQEEEEAASAAAEDALAAEHEASVNEAGDDEGAEENASETDAGAETSGEFAEAAHGENASSTPDYVGGETDTGEEALVQKRMARFLRSYKIQEVIRRRQILLVQVVKEERGNKGAALTTYVSLAGRYCVLMPNALRGGGVSRKITAANDRKRLKDIVAELQLPRGMAMIVRTAGAQRPRPEVMKDCEYLLHLWDDIRDLTVHSSAPALIYEEASLVKRAIRDVYTRDIDEILVDGESGWKSARDFMRMLMPQNAQKVMLWNKSQQPLFSHYQVEGHLDAMLSPTVQLRSGGYLVINQTEALVSIDVNSGRATRERNIEETAVKTNLEAADEVARQLRLRDLAGLIVIDFIDMESRRNNAAVERRLKDALRNDRARIQVGGISHFGLLEMSRQRLRPSVAESAFISCPHCQGTGIVRGIESSALHVLRAVEEEGARRRAAEIAVYMAGEIALYILNHKRSWLADIEARHRMTVTFAADSSLPAPEVRIERIRPQTAYFEPEVTEAEATYSRPPRNEAVVEEAPVRVIPISAPASEEENEPAEALSGEEPREAPATGSEDGTGEPRRRRRRRRRRNGNRDGANAGQQNGNASDNGNLSDDADESEDEEDDMQAGGSEPTQPSMPLATAPMGEDDSNQNLVPGRRRTRHSRKPSQDRGNAPVPYTAPVSAPAPVWRGPTPADPFAGSFDIFDVIEQAGIEAETARRTAPPPVEPVIKTVALDVVSTDAVEAPEPVVEVVIAAAAEEPVVVETTAEAEPKPDRRRGRKPKAEVTAEVVEAPVEVVTDLLGDEAVSETPTRKRRASSRRKSAATAEETASLDATVEAAPAAEPAPVAQAPVAQPPAVQPIVIDEASPAAKPRSGWWRR